MALHLKLKAHSLQKLRTQMVIEFTLLISFRCGIGMRHLRWIILNGYGRRNVEDLNEISEHWQWMCFQDKAVNILIVI